MTADITLIHRRMIRAGRPRARLHRVNRGGGWDRPARYSRSAFRSYYASGFRLNFVGLRVCKVPADK